MNKDADVLLDIKNLSKSYKKGNYTIAALNRVSFSVLKGEIFAIVGESGSGKSTIAKLITRLEDPDEGEIFLDANDISKVRGKKNLKNIYRDIQMVFQDPKASFNPRMKIKDSILESSRNLKCKDHSPSIKELLHLVDLKEEYANRYPHELSGGECQRAAIARAVSVNPRVLICDEATSALDVSAQAQIVDLLAELNERFEMSIILISHDLALVSSLCDRTCVLYQGDVVELGSTRKVIDSPQADYTKKLLKSVLTVDL